MSELILEKLKKMEKLSGIMLIVDNKILLVKSNKNKNFIDQWSIPKGKIDDGETSLDCAIRELEEETGVIIRKENYDSKRIYYTKGDILKELVAYIVRLEKNELNVEVKNDKISNKNYNTEEIYKVKFFDLKRSYRKLQIGQRLLLKNI